MLRKTMTPHHVKLKKLISATVIICAAVKIDKKNLQQHPRVTHLGNNNNYSLFFGVTSMNNFVAFLLAVDLGLNRVS